jgi:predicted porin
VNIDNAGATGAGNFGQNGTATNGSSGGIASRDSWLSIGGNWGEIRTGRISLFWGDGALNQTAANYVNAGVTLSSGVGTGLVTGPTNRTNNVIAYVSPTFSGLNAVVGYVAAAEGHGAAAAAAGTAANATNKTNAQGWSTRINYANGPFTALFDYTAVTAQDVDAATGIAKNIGTKMGLGYKYAEGSQIAVIWSQLKNNNIGAAIGTIAIAGDDLKQNAWTVNWEHTMGNTQLLAQYARAANASGMSGVTTGSSDVRQWMFGAKYNLSKRTGVYATYNRIQNAELAFADYAGGGYTSSQNAAGAGTLGVQQRGADPSVFAVGVMHNF